MFPQMLLSLSGIHLLCCWPNSLHAGGSPEFICFGGLTTLLLGLNILDKGNLLWHHGWVPYLLWKLLQLIAISISQKTVITVGLNSLFFIVSREHQNMWINNAFHTISTLDKSAKLSKCLDAVEYLGDCFMPNLLFMVYKTPLPRFTGQFFGLCPRER